MALHGRVEGRGEAAEGAVVLPWRARRRVDLEELHHAEFRGWKVKKAKTFPIPATCKSNARFLPVTVIGKYSSREQHERLKFIPLLKCRSIEC